MISKWLPGVTAAFAIATAAILAAPKSRAEAPSPEAERWVGAWDMQQGYTAKITSEGGDRLKIDVRNSDPGRTDHQTLTGTLDGRTLKEGTWRGDYKSESRPEGGKRFGTFSITRTGNEITGTQYEDKSSDISPGATFNWKWTRKDE